jgi:hypothetical protein
MFVHNNPAEAPKTVTCGSTSSIYTLRKIVKACETFRRASQKSCLAKDEGERLGGIGSEAAHGAADIGDA